MLYQNAQFMAEQHPDTFEVPTMKKLRASVLTGMLVKVCGGPADDEFLFERFWIEVTDVHADDWITGRCRNNLIHSQLHCGAPVTPFRFENVYDLPSLDCPGYPPTPKTGLGMLMQDGKKIKQVETEPCEIQVREMVKDENGNLILRASLNQPAYPNVLPLTRSFDVLVRFCTVDDYMDKPSSVPAKEWDIGHRVEEIEMVVTRLDTAHDARAFVEILTEVYPELRERVEWT